MTTDVPLMRSVFMFTPIIAIDLSGFTNQSCAFEGHCGAVVTANSSPISSGIASSMTVGAGSVGGATVSSFLHPFAVTAREASRARMTWEGRMADPPGSANTPPGGALSIGANGRHASGDEVIREGD